MTREEAIEWFETHMPTKLMPVAKKAYEMAVFALTHQQGEWISVKDRLPDKPGHYLVCTSINYWHGGCMDKNEEHKYHDSGTPIGYDGTMMSVLDCYYDITGDWNRVFNKHVTHWMPLPEPPEEKESVR